MIRRIPYLILIITFFIQPNSNAQLLPINTIFAGKSPYEQPAFIHDNYWKYGADLSIDLNYRQQWTDLENAPRTTMGSIQYFNEDNHLLIGGSILNDDTSPTNLYGLQLRSAYQILVSSKLNITVGLSGGIFQYRLDISSLDFLEEEIVDSQTNNAIFPEFNLGAVLFYDEKYYAGLGLNQLLGYSIAVGLNNDQNITMQRHITAMSGAYFKLRKNSWIEPSVNLRYIPNQRLYWELLLKYELEEKFWVGIGGTDFGNIHLEAGLIFTQSDHQSGNMFRLGYAFNNYFNTYGTAFGSAHELKLTYSKN